MAKKTIDVLRGEYFNVTGKAAAIRWNRPTLAKKILDAEILKAGHAAHKKVSQPAEKVKSNLEFEKLAGDIPVENINQAVTSEQPLQEKRGGPREGAGRPPGQTDERARIERLLSLQKPDLSVRKVIQGLNLILEKFTPLPFTPAQVESIALGVTLPLYYWFPSTEGAANKWVLHFQALEYIGGPINERMNSINQFVEHDENVKKEESVKKEENSEKKPGQKPGRKPGRKHAKGVKGIGSGKKKKRAP